MDRAVDISHPFASLEWSECRGAPATLSVDGAQAVWLKDKIYVGGGGIFGSRRDAAKLYVYAPTTDTWETIDTPVYWFALTTYNSELVLIGGWKYVGENIMGELSAKLWTLSEYGHWKETLPPMPIPCGTGASAVSHGDNLMVISDDYPKNQVHIYNGHCWASVQHPPQKLSSITSAVFDGHWYLMGEGLDKSQTICVYSASIDSLLASCQTSQSSPIWNTLPDIPFGYCCLAVFGNRVVAVAKRGAITSLDAYSSFFQSWVHTDEYASSSGSNTTPCAVALPSSELIIVSGHSTLKVTLKMMNFDPDQPFTKNAIILMEAAAGIPVMNTLQNYTQCRMIQKILGLVTTPSLDLTSSSLLYYWMRNEQHLPPTWKNLFLIIRLINLDDLAQKMETYLSCSGSIREQPRCKFRKDDVKIKEGDEIKHHQHSQEKSIYHSNQEMLSHTDEKDSILLTSGIQELGPQLSVIPIKEEAVLVPIKTELKREEEAVIITKSEAVSAQPITGSWNLRGVQVCGEMTVVVYSSHYQQITWKGLGLKVHIHEGSLPAGMKQCTINIIASLAGQYEFPENSYLVSAIIWFHCETVQKFARPITVEIQHCSRATNSSLKFTKALCSQKQLPYIFKPLEGGNFTSYSSYGLIELNSFSGVGITQEGSEDREYCSQLFYLGQPNFCKIHFVVTWNMEAHLTAVIKKYENEGAILGLQQPLEFNEDTITLDIPMEGITINSWKIIPLIRPVVTKKQVDNFREGKLTPCCQLLAELVRKKRKNVPSVRHQVSLKGAKYPNDVFTLNLPMEGPPPPKRSRSEGDESTNSLSQGVSGQVISDTPTIKTLLNELRIKVADEWEDIGIQLDIEEGQLKQIKSDNVGVSKACLRDMLRVWLGRVVPSPSWSAMADALDALGHQDIASHLRYTYCQ